MQKVHSYIAIAINTQNTNMYIAMPNRNYTAVCILSRGVSRIFVMGFPSLRNYRNMTLISCLKY